ncbi:MAG: acyltransferase family protein [Gammaproteobacteria bacterium]|nr:acyltransferase family protein [Gammaproteobacteria bacterium]
MTGVTEVEVTATIGRIDALDALRAAVMILGVFLHGAAAFMQVPLSGLIWPVADPSTGWGFDLVVWYLHGFRIPLFFLVAGFFAALLYQARGTRVFLLHRLKRIAVPLAIAIPILLPATYFIWGAGLVERGLVTWRELGRMSFSDPVLKDDLLGLAHLWFLQYLLIYCFAYAVTLEWWPKALRFTLPHPLPESWVVWFPLPWLGATFLLLVIKPEIYTQFDNRWVPDPLGLVYYAVFFIAGTCIYPARERLSLLIPRYHIFLGASVALFAVPFWVLCLSPTHSADSSSLDWGFALSVSLYSWAAVWGFLGLFLSRAKDISQRIRYLSDAAYWIYLVHLPVVGLSQVAVSRLGTWLTISIPPIVVFLISVGFTLSIALITYRYVVRYGVIGRWLNGPREPSPIGNQGN